MFWPSATMPMLFLPIKYYLTGQCGECCYSVSLRRLNQSLQWSSRRKRSIFSLCPSNGQCLWLMCETEICNKVFVSVARKFIANPQQQISPSRSNSNNVDHGAVMEGKLWSRRWAQLRGAKSIVLYLLGNSGSRKHWWYFIAKPYGIMFCPVLIVLIDIMW